MILLKFGKREHLEQLKNGLVHFRPIEEFQRDPTSYRGDSMEGRLYLDPNSPFLIDGVDYSNYIEKVVVSYTTPGATLSFSAAMLTKRNCHRTNNGLYALNDAFIDEMRQFGECFLAFNSYAIISALKSRLDSEEACYEYRPITYCDKKDYQSVREHFSSMPEGEREFGHLFVKDIQYAKQYEWRMVILDNLNLFPIDSSGGTNIKINFKCPMPVMEVNSLSSLQCSEEFLFD